MDGQLQEQIQIQKKVKLAHQRVERATEALTVLSIELARGWGCHLVAKSVHQAYNNRRIRCLYYFFATTRTSCEDLSILALTNVALPDEDKKYKTANISYLLYQLETAVNTVAKLMDKFARSAVIAQLPDKSDRSSAALLHLLDVSHKGVIASIHEYRQQLEDLKPVIEKLEERRSKVIAHLDRKLVNDPTAVLGRPLYSSEVEHAFQTLFKIIKGCYWHLGSELVLDLLVRGLSEDFEYLISLVERNNERPCHMKSPNVLEEYDDNQTSTAQCFQQRGTGGIRPGAGRAGCGVDRHRWHSPHP